LHNFVSRKESISVWFSVSGWSAAASTKLARDQALAFIGMSLNFRPLSPGFVTKSLHVWKPCEHIGKCNWLPSSAGLLTKEHNPDNGYERKTLPPLHLIFLGVERPLAHDLVKRNFDGVFNRSKDLLSGNPSMSRVTYQDGFLFVSMTRRAFA
jgi:hypothetical protein